MDDAEPNGTEVAFHAMSFTARADVETGGIGGVEHEISRLVDRYAAQTFFGLVHELEFDPRGFDVLGAKTERRTQPLIYHASERDGCELANAVAVRAEFVAKRGSVDGPAATNDTPEIHVNLDVPV